MTSYTVVYSANTQSLNSSIVPTAAQSCQENVCTYVLDVPNSLCKSSNINTNVTISASNALGRGPFSDMDIIGMYHAHNNNIHVIILVQVMTCMTIINILLNV